MPLRIKTFSAGPLENNVSLVFDPDSKEAIVIDPSFEIQQLQDLISSEKLVIRFILFTHGHFDHFAGLTGLLGKITPQPRVGLHNGDMKIWQDGGGSREFRMLIEPPVEPDLTLFDGQVLQLREEKIHVYHTPGHSPGSVIFYIPVCKTAIVGDLIFYHGVGRTDLEGGSFQVLSDSIREKVFTLPGDTVLIPGHGLFTCVEEEIENNPFVQPIG